MKMQSEILKLSHADIRKLPDNKIEGIVKNWRKIHYDTIVLAYGESKFRNLHLDDTLKELAPLFTLKNLQSMDELLESYLKTKGVKTYEQLVSALENQVLEHKASEPSGQPHHQEVTRPITTQDAITTDAENHLSSQEKLEQLKNLQDLHKSGAISSAEFEQLKKEILLAQAARQVAKTKPPHYARQSKPNQKVRTENQYSQTNPLNSKQSKTKSMFQSPFSFDGRIRRTEYGLSYIIYMVAYGIINALAMSMSSPFIYLAIIPVAWFIIAQGAKRCHDRGNNGWYQIIPFYMFWMIFADSEVGVNEYGENPKGIGNQPNL